MLARQIAVGFGIALILPMLIYYGVATFDPPPPMGPTAKEFARVLVIVSTPIGLAAILIGAYLKLHAIGTGLIFGGIFAVTLGYTTYWQYFDDWIRFVSLLVGFAVLIFVGLRRVTVTNKESTG